MIFLNYVHLLWIVYHKKCRSLFFIKLLRRVLYSLYRLTFSIEGCLIDFTYNLFFIVTDFFKAWVNQDFLLRLFSLIDLIGKQASYMLEYFWRNIVNACCGWLLLKTSEKSFAFIFAWKSEILFWVYCRACIYLGLSSLDWWLSTTNNGKWSLISVYNIPVNNWSFIAFENILSIRVAEFW